MSVLNFKQKVLCILLVILTGSGMVAQDLLLEEFVENPNHDLPTVIEEISGFDNLKVYSNEGLIYVKFDNQSFGNVIVQVFDIAGRELVNKEVQKAGSQFNYQYDSSVLPKSIYIVRLFQGKSKTSKKVYL